MAGLLDLNLPERGEREKEHERKVLAAFLELISEGGNTAAARQRFRTIATADERRAIFEAARAARQVDWDMSGDIIDRYLAARADPNHENSGQWLAVETLTPAKIAIFYKRLLDPRSRRGRPAGAGKVISDTDLIDEIERRIRKTGGRITPTVREVLKEKLEPFHGFKDRVGYVARIVRNRVKK